MTTPARIKVATDVLPSRRAKDNTSAITRAAPRKAATGKSHGLSAVGKTFVIVPPRTMTMTLPREAPAVIPMSPRSARGLRRAPCRAAPERAKAAPAARPSKSRDRRMTHKTAVSTLLPWPRNVDQRRSGGILTGPDAKAATARRPTANSRKASHRSWPCRTLSTYPWDLETSLHSRLGLEGPNQLGDSLRGAGSKAKQQ